MYKLISGKEVSQAVKLRVCDEVNELRAQGIEPCLAVILVGDDPASRVYVNNKKKACEFCGIRSLEYVLPADTKEEELIALVENLNNDKAVNGIGIMEMLRYENIDLDGKNCVVIGRSNIVGKPMAMLMLKENATVTICHSRTKNLKEVVAGADVIVAAVGRPNFVTADMVKDGAVIIDVGINRMDDGTLCGDVDFEACKEKASYITPVPGGVGPMTIATLMQNTITATKIQNQN